jgi:hypothetical protein
MDPPGFEPGASAVRRQRSSELIYGPVFILVLVKNFINYIF